MSNQETNALVEVEEERKFWRDPRVPNIFNLFTQGKNISFIAETLQMKPVTVENLVTNKFFITKLEQHLRGVLFTNQVAKVIAASDVFSKLWDRVTDNISDIPPEICLKELTKMFPQKREGMILNPKNINVFMKVMDQAKDPADIGERLMDMGFDGLEEDDEAIYPELGEGPEEDGNKQGDHSMDPEEPSQD